MARCATRPDHEGFSVFDVWTGEVAVIATLPQTEMSREDAEQLADLLNRRSRQGERKVYQ
jgi:hypothetical protein